jgi:hypothetical protein
MVYVLWKHDKYITLGQDLPALKAEPFIDTKILNGDEIGLRYGDKTNIGAETQSLVGEGMLLDKEIENLTSDNFVNTITFSAERQTVIADRIFSSINLYNRMLKEQGLFFEPFFVRFAYKLREGGYTKHTEPVLLIPNSLGGPIPWVDVGEGNAVFNPIYTVSTLSAKISAELSAWKDIIENISVFVSPPITGYADSAKSVRSISKAKWFVDDELNVDMTPMIMDGDEYKPIASVLPSSSIFDFESLRRYKKRTLYKCFKKGYDNHRYVIQDDGEDGLFYIRVIDYNFSIPLPRNISFNLSEFSHEQKEDGESPDGFYLPKGKYFIIDPYKLSLSHNLEWREKIGFKRAMTGYEVRWNNVDTTSTNSDANKESSVMQNIKFVIDLKRADGKTLSDAVVGEQTFYLISEIDTEELIDPEGLTEGYWNGAINVNKNALINIPTKDVLPDIGRMETRPLLRHVFVYNNRLHTIPYSEKFWGSDIFSQTPTKHYMREQGDSIIKAYVSIKENSQNILLETKCKDQNLADLIYYTYQRNTADRLILYCGEGGYVEMKVSIALKRHDFLNQSYAFNNFDSLDYTIEETYEEGVYIDNFNWPTTYDTIKIGNQIRTSEVDNPFVFSEERTTDIPTEEIYAVSTAAKPLSEGQFGQFPLYAFTSDGVWAMQTMDDGTYVARQPISQDVCTNPEAITQLDTSVIFPTQRGLMMLSGANAECISDAIDTPYPFNVHELPHYGDLAMELGWGDDEYEIKPFMEFAQEAKAIYNYAAQQIIYYNPNQDYAYVFDLGSRTWGMMQSDIAYNINAYPLAMAVTNDNELVEFVKPDKDSKYNEQRLLTRPIKLGGPDVLKTIDTIIARGRFSKGEVKLVLYGSRDLENWRIIKTSKTHRITGIAGTPYKYFRILIIANMDGDSNMTSLSVDFMPRYNNKLR